MGEGGKRLSSLPPPAEHKRFSAIPARFQTKVIEILPTDLPLEVTAPQIVDEYYWERCASERWKNCQVVEHGGSWKRLYLERNLEDEIESLDETQANLDRLIQVRADPPPSPPPGARMCRPARSQASCDRKGQLRRLGQD